MISTERTEEEFWKIINTPVNITNEELSNFNRVPAYEEIQKSIEKNGMGLITYAENHRDKNLGLFGTKEIQISKEDLEKAKMENEKDTEVLEVPFFTRGKNNDKHII